MTLKCSLLICAVATVLAACGNSPTPHVAANMADVTNANASADAARQLQRIQMNSLTIEATVVPTLDLDASVTQRYAIPRNQDTAMLLLTVRNATGDATDDAGLQLQARAGTLEQAPQPVQLRRLAIDGYTDYVASIPMRAPGTLRVEVDAQRSGSRAQMRFTRDFAPR